MKMFVQSRMSAGGHSAGAIKEEIVMKKLVTIFAIGLTMAVGLQGEWADRWFKNNTGQTIAIKLQHNKKRWVFKNEKSCFKFVMYKDAHKIAHVKIPDKNGLTVEVLTLDGKRLFEEESEGAQFLFYKITLSKDGTLVLEKTNKMPRARKQDIYRPESEFLEKRGFGPCEVE